MRDPKMLKQFVDEEFGISSRHEWVAGNPPLLTFSIEDDYIALRKDQVFGDTLDGLLRIISGIIDTNRSIRLKKIQEDFRSFHALPAPRPRVRAVVVEAHLSRCDLAGAMFFKAAK